MSTKSNKQVIELLYNSFNKIPNEELLEKSFYVKSDDEYIHIADAYSGEFKFIIDRIKAFNKSKLKFTIVYQDSMARMAKDLSGSSLKIMIYLMSKAKFNNLVYEIKYAEISDKLGNMSYETITKSFRELKEKNYIKATGKRTNLVYHIAPSICWRGSVSSMYNKLKMFLE